MIEKEKLVAVVSAAQRGEESATAELFEIFQSDIYYFILKTVNNDRELAEDLTQDTFMEILETIHKLEEPAAFVTWSKQIAYHRCTAYFRKRKELLVDENEDGYSVFDTIEETNEEFIPDAALDHEDLKNTIMGMIRELPEEQRAAIILRYFNEVSVKEIAEIQGVSEGTIKSRLNYARKAIKQSVEDYEKKNGIKLHCAGVLPLMLWFFRQYRVGKDLSFCMGTATQKFVIAEGTAAAAAAATTAAGTVAAATGATAAATSATAATAATTAAATAATAATAAGTAAAVTGTALTTKIVAGILAAAVAVGGIVAGTTSSNRNNESPRREPAAATAAHGSPEEQLPEDSGAVPEGTEATEKAVCTDHEMVDVYWLNGEKLVYLGKQCGNCKEVDTSGGCQHTFGDGPERIRQEEKGAYADYRCEKCGIVISAPHSSGCAHDWYYRTVSENGATTEKRICHICFKEELVGGGAGETEEAGETKEAGDCAHDWEMIERYDGSNVLLYRARRCAICQSMEVLYSSMENNNCEHIWHYYTDYVDNKIIEGQYCPACGADEVTSVKDNNCQHVWQEEISGNDGMVYRAEVCTGCGMRIFHEPYPCTHTWSYGEPYVAGDGKTYKQRTCQVCRKFETIQLDDCEHNMVTVSKTSENGRVVENRTCSKCGAKETISYQETLPDECAHNWEVWPDYTKCSMCGAVKDVTPAPTDPPSTEPPSTEPPSTEPPAQPEATNPEQGGEDGGEGNGTESGDGQENP